MSAERHRLVGTPVAARLLELGERTPAEALLERARELGRAEAAADGVAAARDEAAAALRAAVRELDAFRRRAAADVARTSVELAVAIARRLLRAELARGAYDLEAIVREALTTAASERGTCVVHLNPADLARLERVGFRSGTELRADVGVRVGDVQVETELGLCVREMDEALETISARLLEELG